MFLIFGVGTIQKVLERLVGHNCLDTVIILLCCKANIFLLDDTHLFYHIGLLPSSNESSLSSIAFKLKVLANGLAVCDYSYRAC